jgi:hypothetical protein
MNTLFCKWQEHSFPWWGCGKHYPELSNFFQCKPRTYCKTEHWREIQTMGVHHWVSDDSTWRVMTKFKPATRVKNRGSCSMKFPKDCIPSQLVHSNTYSTTILQCAIRWKPHFFHPNLPDPSSQKLQFSTLISPFGAKKKKTIFPTLVLPFRAKTTFLILWIGFFPLG